MYRPPLSHASRAPRPTRRPAYNVEGLHINDTYIYINVYIHITIYIYFARPSATQAARLAPRVGRPANVTQLYKGLLALSDLSIYLSIYMRNYIYIHTYVYMYRSPLSHASRAPRPTRRPAYNVEGLHINDTYIYKCIHTYNYIYFSLALQPRQPRALPHASAGLGKVCKHMINT